MKKLIDEQTRTRWSKLAGLNEDYQKDMKNLENNLWEYEWDAGAGHGALYNENNGVTIFEPYNAIEDREDFFRNYKIKGNWEVQVATERDDKMFWFKDYKSALNGVKNLMKKYSK